MSTVLPMPHPAPTLDDDAWEDLLNFIDERRVIPIIGPELLKVETEAGPRLLYDWVAEKLAARLNVDTTRLPQPPTLNDVVCWYLSSHGRREDTYTRMRTILREATFAPPLALRQLAQITDFDLLVTTTCDPRRIRRARDARRPRRVADHLPAAGVGNSGVAVVLVRADARYATLPKLGSTAPVGGFNPARRHPCAMGPAGSSVYRYFIPPL
jgi:hypothetical protein